jgi:hypothetical protein
VEAFGPHRFRSRDFGIAPGDADGPLGRSVPSVRSKRGPSAPNRLDLQQVVVRIRRAPPRGASGDHQMLRYVEPAAEIITDRAWELVAGIGQTEESVAAIAPGPHCFGHRHRSNQCRCRPSPEGIGMRILSDLRATSEMENGGPRSVARNGIERRDLARVQFN